MRIERWRDLDKLEGRAIRKHIKFNKRKCWILHLGQSNSAYKYRQVKEAGEQSH